MTHLRPDSQKAAGDGGQALLIATTNPNKIREIRPLLADLPIDLITLGGCGASAGT